MVKSEKLRQLVRSNKSRLFAQDYARSLRDERGEFLSRCPLLDIAEFDAWIAATTTSPDGIGNPVHRPESYSYSRVAWEDEAFALLESAGDSRDGDDAVLLVYAPAADSREAGFRLPFRWARANFRAVWLPQLSMLRLVTLSRNAGLSLDTRGGYIPGDINPNELIYVAARWGV